jgi:hypothetical protein
MNPTRNVYGSDGGNVDADEVEAAGADAAVVAAAALVGAAAPVVGAAAAVVAAAAAVVGDALVDVDVPSLPHAARKATVAINSAPRARRDKGWVCMGEERSWC